MRLRRGWGSGVAALGGFSPLSLFTASEPGFWYDPSDMTTLFQDSAGSTPVTATGQPVGLVLDKRLGLVPGAEKVSNGTFDTNVTGWSVGPLSGTPSWSAGEMLVTVNVPNGRAQTTLSGMTVGATYRLTATMRVVTPSGGSWAWIGVSASGLGVSEFVQTTSATNVTLTRTFTADATTMILVAGDNSGTSGAVFAFDDISVKEIPGNHASQSTAGSRPVLQQVGANYCLRFDGVDDFLVTGTITPGVDKAQVFAGVTGNASDGMICEFSADLNSSAGAFFLYNNNGASRYEFQSRGSLAGSASTSARTAPDTAVIAAQSDIATDANSIRQDAVAGTPSAVDQGTGNFLAYPAYIGRRGGTTLPFNGDIYSMIVRFGANLTADQISATESYVAGKTGVTL